MNPTDQWRKESRKKELKKNKKQRVAVREAVIKTKSPAAIIKEIEDIEQQGTCHVLAVDCVKYFTYRSRCYSVAHGESFEGKETQTN